MRWCGAVGVVGLLVLAGCSEPAPGDPQQDGAFRGGALVTLAERPAPSYTSDLLVTSGRVGADERGCVTLASRAGPNVAVWPYGWTAEVTGESVTIRDAEHRVVAHDGDWMKSDSGGGFDSIDRSLRCVPPEGPLTAFTSPEVLPGEPFDLRTGLPLAAVRQVGPDRLTGRVSAAPDGCVRIAGVSVTWPAGDEGFVEEGGLVVRYQDGGVVVREGQVATVRGTRVHPKRGGCDVGRLGEFQIEARVRVRG